MADFGLPIEVLAEEDNSNIDNATVTGEIVPVTTQVERAFDDGKTRKVYPIEDLAITITAPGRDPYVAQIYTRPSLQAPVTVHLRRSAA